MGVVEAPSTVPADPDDRRVPFAGVTNFRDLGGYPTAGGGVVRRGVVFRADGLHKLTGDDVAAFGRLGICRVFDLRSEAERTALPNPVESISLPIIGYAGDERPAPPPEMTAAQGEERLRDMYVGALQHSATRLGHLLGELSASDGLPAVFHCHGGKDRTGIVAALFLLALGVDEATILDDYQATSRYRTLEHQRDSHDNLIAAGLSPEGAVAVLGTPHWAMAAALAAIGETYGGIESYLTGVAGMSESTLSRLREVHIERGQASGVAP